MQYKLEGLAQKAVAIIELALVTAMDGVDVGVMIDEFGDPPVIDEEAELLEIIIGTAMLDVSLAIPGEVVQYLNDEFGVDIGD